MTRKQGNKRENGLPTGGGGRKADFRREEDISAATGADSMNGEVGEDSGSSLDIMDTSVIAMVNLYLKNISSSERYIILKNIVSQRNTEDEPGIRAHIDGAKLADLIDKAKAYWAELLNVRNIMAFSAPRSCQPEEPIETVSDTLISVDMSNTKCGMIGSSIDGAEYEYGARLADGVDTEPAEPAAEARVVRVDDMDDDAPKYNPALEMSFNNLINKSWMVLFDLMRNLSGTEYVTHMPYEMAEMITDYYYKLL